MPPAFAYIIDELIHVDYSDENKKVYYDEIIRSIIDSEMGAEFIEALCNLIQNLTIDNLHIIGDIFDRGPRADIIMEELMKFHDVDIQWGNHDISWMGAATGNLACICNVLRIAIRYNASTFWRTATESTCVRCPCLQPESTGTMPASTLCRRSWMKIFMTRWILGWRPRCTRPSL